MKYPCLLNYLRKKTNNKSFFYGIEADSFLSYHDECLLLKFLKISFIRHFLTWNKISNFSFMFSNLLYFDHFYNKKLSICLYFIDNFILILTYERLLFNSTLSLFHFEERCVSDSFFLFEIMLHLYWWFNHEIY